MTLLVPLGLLALALAFGLAWFSTRLAGLAWVGATCLGFHWAITIYPTGYGPQLDTTYLSHAMLITLVLYVSVMGLSGIGAAHLARGSARGEGA
ncbi:MAG: hypothetical protein AAF214_00525 [Pseudomonadota bacterium]